MWVRYKKHKSFPMMYHLSYLDIKHGILKKYRGDQIDPSPAGIGSNNLILTMHQHVCCLLLSLYERELSQFCQC